MAVEQQPVTVSSDRQPAKGVPEQISAAYGDGTLDTARTRLKGRRGPKTTAGKARVAVNALTHGISSTRPVVPGESSDEWDTHRAAVVEALVPAGPLETALAERVASAVWRLRRVTTYEEAAIAERQHLPTASARCCRIRSRLTRLSAMKRISPGSSSRLCTSWKPCARRGAVSRRRYSESISGARPTRSPPERGRLHEPPRR